MGVNKVILVGNLGKDPELKYTPGGQAVATFSLATSERFTDKNGQRQDRTEWHNIVVWGKQAEIVNQYLKKGRTVYLEGSIRTRSWDDKDGVKKYRTEINVQTFQFIGGNGGGAPSSGGSSGSSYSDPGIPEMPSYDMGPVSQDSMADDLPF